ncbi:MAG: ribbon-helix-helix protein, CopG family [Hyphomicrobiales bacterium]|nr:ribbon-helix-helix protein, CopG family [Hyphomicrobiales bacterium]
MRMHPDLLDQLSLLARERGMSRSAYIERVLLGWLNSDPRNPRLDGIGRKVEGVPTPHELLQTNGVRFGERWSKFSELSMALLGEKAQDQWLYDFQDQAIPSVPPFRPVGDGEDD